MYIYIYIYIYDYVYIYNYVYICNIICNIIYIYIYSKRPPPGPPIMYVLHFFFGHVCFLMNRARVRSMCI